MIIMNRIFYLLIIILSLAMAEQKYKEPQFSLIEKMDNIEIRQYNEYVIAKTSIPLNKDKEEKLKLSEKDLNTSTS